MAESVDSEVNIPETEIRRIEHLFKKSRGANRSSIMRRGSMRLKSGNRQSSLINREDLNGVQNLADYFENVEKNIELIDEYCEKRRIFFLRELKCKMPNEQYKSFLSSVQMYKVPEGGKLQQEGKFHNYHYIIIQGNIGAFHQRKIKDEEWQYLEMFQYEVGEALISNLLQTHKANPYTVRAKKYSTLLRFTDDVYTRFLKKIWTKETDELASLLSHTLVFKSISTVEIKKFLPFCSIRRFRYNELVYEEGDLIKQLLLIVDGEAEISYEIEEKNRNSGSKASMAPIVTPNFYRLNHQPNDKKQIKIVRVGKKELFGLEAFQVFKENYYEHHARVTSDHLKVLAIGLDVLYDIEIENPILEQNLNLYLKKINKIHTKLLEKHQNINLSLPQKKKKRKRRLKRKQQNSLEWWGLAAKIEDSKKYRLPSPPKNHSAKHLARKQPLQIVNRTSKLEYFKRRLFEDQIQALQAIQEKQNEDGCHPGGLIPRLNKMKIKMLNAKPKVINNAEKVKRKLMQYAKNGDVFCDKLQLE